MRQFSVVNAIDNYIFRIGSHSRWSLILYFAKISMITFCTGVLVSQIFIYIYPELSLIISRDYKDNFHILLSIAFGVFISPIGETCLLLYCVSLSQQSLKSIYGASAVGSLPIVLLHSFIDWKISIAAFLPFLIQSIAFINVRKIMKLSSCFWFICGVHSFGNLLTIFLTVVTN